MNLQDLLFKPTVIQVGEVRVIDGNRAIAYRGGCEEDARWIIERRFTEFTFHRSGYLDALCLSVDGISKTATFQIIKGSFAPASILTIPIGIMARYRLLSEGDAHELESQLKAILESGVTPEIATEKTLQERWESRQDVYRKEERARFERLIGSELCQWIVELHSIYLHLEAEVSNDLRRYREIPKPSTAKVLKQLAATLARQPKQYGEGS